MSKELKSAYELAMERLKKKDAGFEEKELSDAQKQEIEEIRQTYRAKNAERDIMFKSKLTKLAAEVPPGELMIQRQVIENAHQRDIAVLKNAMDEKISKVREP